MPRMAPLRLSLEFRGHATRLEPGVLLGRASAPNLGREDALLETRVSLLDGGEFEESGTISWGVGDALRSRTRRPGSLVSSPEPNLSRGSAVCEVDGGAGRFKGAEGTVATSFVVSETGELTESQQAVVFVPAE
jgi:hypothetical protein